MPLNTHKNVVFSQWESLTDTKLFCSSCSTLSTLMLSNLGDRQHPWKMMNYFPLTFSHFKGHPCPWKMMYLKPCHCFARSVLLCVVLCSAVPFCDLMCLYAEHKTKIWLAWQEMLTFPLVISENFDLVNDLQLFTIWCCEQTQTHRDVIPSEIYVSGDSGE